jgi:CBS domain-containing protein
VFVNIREVMTANPVCCMPNDTVQQAAMLMRDYNIGSIPVVVDQESRELLGIITDRDLCCAVLAAGLDPKITPIEKYVSLQPVTCRDGENVEKCELAMQENKLRRIPIVDGERRCIGIVSLADVALKDNAERVSKTISEISKPGSRRPIAA